MLQSFAAVLIGYMAAKGVDIRVLGPDRLKRGTPAGFNVEIRNATTAKLQIASNRRDLRLEFRDEHHRPVGDIDFIGNIRLSLPTARDIRSINKSDKIEITIPIHTSQQMLVKPGHYEVRCVLLPITELSRASLRQSGYLIRPVPELWTSGAASPWHALDIE
ncbi:MAG TPA: hypothetical protein VMI31_17530 [Fimbriimonadaceae bacterium]|nr:hypothetical protein [Fimbriimonadaceae bacterium]